MLSARCASATRDAAAQRRADEKSVAPRCARIIDVFLAFDYATMFAGYAFAFDMPAPMPLLTIRAAACYFDLLSRRC